MSEWSKECMEGRYGASLAKTTRDTHNQHRVGTLDESPLARLRLHRITRAKCQAFVDELVGAEYAPAYVRRIVATTSKFLSLAVREGYILTNPMTGLELPKVEERKNRTLSPKEAIQLLNPQSRTGAVVLLALHCGLRRGELTRLKWEHIEGDLIKVPGTKSKNAKRTVPLTPEARDAINAQPRRCDYIFSTHDGRPLTVWRIDKDFASHKAELGIPAETRLHDLRGTFVSLLVQQGVDIRTIMELVGHGDSRTTVGAYARSRDEVKQMAVAKLRESITKQPEKATKRASRQQRVSG